MLRFITAGSVDDGKSTLIGRLLFDSKAVLSDQRGILTRYSSEPAPPETMSEMSVDKPG